ncbi:hypothetical protein ACFFQF_02665 [Haladaptatus pallidirubidus]|uniref:Uncharacterized protein n=1 Tax=Haladaptatus pallidirubidus TaxID=1008152 RepID=A0AAV3UB88_9EURY|nr:hypothetical protein [Haladaptatus pallidirubidus]
MSYEAQSVRANSWTNPEQCPFCDATLEDGGWGFIAHVRTNSSCRTEYDMWREQITGDMSGEWGG